ncbi:MAG: glycosyltransferase family 2 protein [Muribaculaceae bacterium]|nr:glycosyltransferase family 2 protein [Muribaculaceae bacterium]
MEDFKLRLSDIFKYIVLGAVQAALSYLLFSDELSEWADSAALKFLFQEPVATLVVALSVFYFAGYMTQMVIQVFCKGNLAGTGLGEIGLFINKYPDNPLNLNKYPHWLYYSHRPDKVLDIYREIMGTGRDSDVKTEFLYANNLFQGIALSLIVFACFALPGTDPVWDAVVAFALVLILCVLGNRAVKNDRWALVVNKLMIVLVPLGIILVYCTKYTDFVLATMGLDRKMVATDGVVIGCLVFLCLVIAEQLTRRHIRRIDVLIKYGSGEETEKKFIDTLRRNGVPRAFVLTRVSDSGCDYYREQLESVKNQIYPNKKVIALIDSASARYDEIVRTVEEFRANGLDITHYTSEGRGAACLSYEIRDIFINYADADDVCISLDSDDLFASVHSVSRIMGRIARTKANICLLTFEFFGESRLNFSKNYPNDIVRDIARNFTDKGRAIASAQIMDMGYAHLVSTIGWTKCYRKDVLKRYQSLLAPEVKHMEEKSKYEDFPDIVALLNKDSKICAVGQTSILFRKHDGSVTTAENREKYETHITYYLKLAKTLGNVEEGLCEGAGALIAGKFVPYKFVQYLNRVLKKTTDDPVTIKDYSAKEFFDHFSSEVYVDDLTTLIEGMVDILNESYENLERVGYYGKDLPKSLNKPGVNFTDIKAAYGL